MASPSAPSTCPLLDLPDDLLLRCMPQPQYSLERYNTGLWAFKGSREACRKLFKLQAAGSNSRSLRFCLDEAAEEGPPRARKTLALMAQSFPELKKLALRMHTAEHLGSLFAPPGEQAAWLMNLVDITISPFIPQYSPTTRLSAPQLDSFIPQCVASACPQLQRLVLSWAFCKQQQHQQQPASLPCLEELVLDNCVIEMEPEAVHQQLQALPSLTKFKLDLQNDPPAGEQVKLSEGLSSRVTELCARSYSTVVSLKWQWPMLQSLDLGDLVEREDGVQVIAETMPRLEHLKVTDFSLGARVRKPPPNLQSVTIKTNRFCWRTLVAVRNFLVCYEHPPSLYFHGRDATVDLSWYGGSADQAKRFLAMAASVVSEIQRAGGLQVEDHVRNHLRSDHARHLPRSETSALPEVVVFNFHTQTRQPRVQQVLHRLLPIFPNLRCLVLQGGIRVNAALLTAVGQLPNLVQLKLQDERPGQWHSMQCQFAEEMWSGGMISLLPEHVKFIDLMCQQATEEQVICMCTTAPRTIKVRVTPLQWKDMPARLLQWEDLVRWDHVRWEAGAATQAVKAAARRSLVRLEIVQCLPSVHDYYTH